ALLSVWALGLPAGDVLIYFMCTMMLLFIVTVPCYVLTTRRTSVERDCPSCDQGTTSNRSPNGRRSKVRAAWARCRTQVLPHDVDHAPRAGRGFGESSHVVGQGPERTATGPLRALMATHGHPSCVAITLRSAQ